MPRVLRTAAGIVACAVTACGDGSTSTFASIGTGGTGGVYYPLGGALANHLSVTDSSRRYTAEVTGGSVENVNRVAAGDIELGFVTANTIHDAYHGGPDHPDGLPQLRVAAPLYPSVIHLLAARHAAPISVTALRGRRISVGSPGSGTEQAARQILAAAGLTYADVRVRYLSFRESADALRDGAIDAAFMIAGFPAAAALEVTTSAGARLVPIDGAVLDTVVARHPYYHEATIPARVYPGLDAPVTTVGLMNWIVASAATDSTVVDALLTVLTERREALIGVHEMARRIDLTALARPAPIPLHPASTAWWTRHSGDRPPGS